MSIDPSAAPDLLPAPQSSVGVRSRTSMRRLGFGILLSTAAWAVPTIGTSSILLPAKIALIDPDQKIVVLGLITALGALSSMLSGIIFGAISDLTRTRFGSRTPWIVTGAILAGIFMLLLSTAGTIPLLLLWWCLFSASLNVMPLTAIIPDRVPAAKRGGISSAYGVGVLASASIGTVLAAQFIGDPSAGMRVFAPLVVILPIMFVLIAPDFSNVGVPRRSTGVRGVLSSFAFPRKAPDFYWALFGRLLITLGSNMVGTYQLYILTDYIHADQTTAGTIISIGSAINFVASIGGAAIAGPISDRIGRRKLPVFISSLLFGAAILIPFLVPVPASMLFYFGVAGIGFGIYFSVDAALITEVLPSAEQRGKDSGILNMANTGGGVLAPALTSAIIGIGIGFAPVFAAAIILAIAGGITVLPIKSVR
ncbi:MAG TPA: MFS transporter [Lacisediminihabitans sp.]|uniref:MFS transporter n=1 Tax=Lacisediminihabitans sp. TaxID=2787631 RepID=UPI002EDA92D8